jgi:hypothetical protein
MSHYVMKRPIAWERIAVSSTPVGPTSTSAAPSREMASNYALFACEGANVRWRDDGVAPNSASSGSLGGMLLSSGESLEYDGDPTKVQFIRVSSDAVVNVVYYRAG